MERLDAYYGNLVKTDPDLAKIDKKSFREYYVLRASVAFSFGSHDEWNIVRAINEALGARFLPPPSVCAARRRRANVHGRRSWCASAGRESATSARVYCSNRRRSPTRGANSGARER